MGAFILGLSSIEERKSDFNDAAFYDAPAVLILATDSQASRSELRTDASSRLAPEIDDRFWELRHSGTGRAAHVMPSFEIRVYSFADTEILPE